MTKPTAKKEKSYWTIAGEQLKDGPHKIIWQNSFAKVNTDLPGTIQDLVDLTQTYPKNLRLIRSIVTLSLKNKNTKMAIEYLEKGLHIKSNCVFLLQDLANQKLQSGDLKGALKIADQIELEMATSDDDEKNNLASIKAIRGLVFYKQGKRKEALNLLLDADEISMLFALGFDGYDEALTDLEDN